LAQLRSAADGLTPAGVFTALEAIESLGGSDPSGGLEGVRPQLVLVACSALLAVPRTDVRATGVAGHLAPLDDEHRARADGLAEARNGGYRAFEKARDEYNAWLNSNVGLGV
jgi:hypothetical protein